MERAVGKNEKLESFKLESLKLESFAEVGKSQAKLERTERSWKEPIEVRKFELKLERLNADGKLTNSFLFSFAGLFPTLAKLSNLKLSIFSFFPTALSNYTHPNLHIIHIMKFLNERAIIFLEYLKRP